MNGIPKFFRQHPIGTVLILCFFLLAAFIVRNLTAPVEDKRLDSIRQAGYPVTLADLNQYYPEITDDQNAAIIYRRVFESQFFTNTILDDAIADLEKTPRGEAVPQAAREKLAAFLGSNAPTWQLLYEATNLPASRYPLDMQAGHMLLLPHLAKVKRGTQLLSLEALSHASSGESNQAYAAMNAALHVGDSLRDEPILISYLVRIACSALAGKRLEQSLNLVSFQDSQLRSLQEQFAAAQDSRFPARALAGERAFGLSFFIDRHIQRTMMQPQQGIGMGPTGVAGQMALTAYRACGLMAKDRNYYLDVMGSNIAVAGLPAEERVKAGTPPGMVITNKFLVLSRMTLPALSKVLDRANENAARLRVAETALAVERFRLGHAGAPPDNLQQLAPQYLPEVPLDPFASQPLRYKRLPRGFVVYSIGPDQKDDGGAEPTPRQKTGKVTKPTAADLTFVVERN